MNKTILVVIGLVIIGICAALVLSNGVKELLPSGVKELLPPKETIEPPKPLLETPAPTGAPTLEQLEIQLKEYQAKYPELIKQANQMQIDIIVLQGAIYREKQLRGIPLELPKVEEKKDANPK